MWKNIKKEGKRNRMPPFILEIIVSVAVRLPYKDLNRTHLRYN
jgi:hypothetical protein